MSTDTATEQNFRREYGPGDNGEMSGQEDVVFELTNGYVGDPTPSGRIPHIDITYYVEFYEASRTNQPDEKGDLWAVNCVSHSYLTHPDDPYGPDNPTDDEFDYEGGSDLWYYTEAEAIEVCRDNFAKYDEAWKMNSWTPA
jgi:hypothetical protein